MTQLNAPSVFCRGFLLLTLLFGLSPLAAEAADLSPKATVDVTVEKIRSTVKAEKSSLTEEQLDKKLRELIFPVFDFREMSRRSLGANWNKANPAQQTEFVDLFSDMLARNYLKKIRSNAEISAIAIVGEKIKGERALVKTLITTDDQKATVDYRMRRKGSGWKIYDVIVENIGLVTNYRSEFANIVKKEKIDGLLVKLREKKL